VHEITTSYGTVVREYVSPGDKVFAVSWRGPVIPELRQMLGNYYAQYEQAASAPRVRDHRHLAIGQPVDGDRSDRGEAADSSRGSAAGRGSPAATGRRSTIRLTPGEES